jgi:choline transport protein
MADTNNAGADDVELRDSAELHDGSVVVEKKGTPEDRKDMHRMGKVQELRRNFRFVSIFGYSMILMSTWEVTIVYVVLVRGPRYSS